MLLEEIRLEMVLKFLSKIWTPGGINGGQSCNRTLGLVSSSRKP